jgi:hypothetical protein
MKNMLRTAVFALFAWGAGVSAEPDSTAAAAPDAAAGAAVANAATVDSIVFATGIKDRVPTGSSKEFGPQMQKVFCWTKISIQHAPFKFKHVWYNGDEKVLEVPLRLGYASGRLWSYKTVTPGTWKVDIVDEAGNVLGSSTFNAK